MNSQSRCFAILVSLVAGLLVSLDPGVLHATTTKVGVAMAQIEVFGDEISAFKADVGRYPTTAEGLQALRSRPPQVTDWKGPYIPKEIPTDPWGQPYVYSCPGKYGTKAYDLYSFGANQTDDRGEKDDVTNWREINREFYGGVPKKISDFLMVLAGVLAVALSIGLFRAGRPPLSAMPIRFAIGSAICMTALIISLGLLSGKLNGGSVGIPGWLAGMTVVACLLAFSLSGVVVTVITVIKCGVKRRYVLTGMVCLIPWVFIMLVVLS
jgi:general secretion pathway protein G